MASAEEESILQLRKIIQHPPRRRARHLPRKRILSASTKEGVTFGGHTTREDFSNTEITTY